MSNSISENLQSTKEKTINNIESILAEGGLLVTGLAKQTLIDNKNYSSGNLSKHITAVQEGLKLEFGNDLEYANTIETGIIDKQVSVNSIQSWLDRKIQLGHIPSSMRKLAVPIANKININGYIKNWHPFMKPSWEEIEPKIKLLIDNAVIQDDK
jgi:hypothetical protein